MTRVETNGARAFIEINPFHAETLYFLHATFTNSSSDCVLGHPRLFTQPLFARIEAHKETLSLWRFLTLLVRDRPVACYFNTINVVLTPMTGEILRLNALTLLLPILARLSGCRICAIVHEADQFFATGIDSCRRHAWYRRGVGWWFRRLFHQLFVLSPEVERFLSRRGAQVSLLDSRPLAGFPRPAADLPARSADEILLCWIGPVSSHRRNADLLLDFDAEWLNAHHVTVVMVCDARTGDGPALRRRLTERGTSARFVFLDYRPDDDELFEWVRQSACILCLYGAPEYGKTKTSGARHIAGAFRKPFLSQTPVMGVYGLDGQPLAEGPDAQSALSAWFRMR
jgi:hypothetical protein